MRTRTRVVLSGGAVAGVTLLSPRVALANEEEETEGEETTEGEEELHEEEEEPNPILPETNEIIWGAISFVLLFFLLARFAFPAVRKAMEARTDRIRGSLDEAERTRAEAQSVLDDYQRQLADARGEAARIIEEARQAADTMRRELMARAEADAAARRQQADQEIEASVQRATAELSRRMAELSVEGAERVLQRALADRDTQVQLVEDYINQVGSRRG